MSVYIVIALTRNTTFYVVFIVSHIELTIWQYVEENFTQTHR